MGMSILCQYLRTNTIFRYAAKFVICPSPGYKHVTQIKPYLCYAIDRNQFLQCYNFYSSKARHKI